MHKNTSTALSLLAIAVGMAMLAYASVPLYRLFCQVTGFGGTTQVATDLPDRIYDRPMTVQFNADTAPQLPWDFRSLQRSVEVKVGENRLAFFRAVNTSDAPTAGTSTFNVLPDQAGQYFVKVECFCFEEQLLAAGESMEFPVSFYIDPKILENKELEDLKTITLSYTFFPVKNY